MFPCFFAHLLIFDRVPDTVNSILLDLDYFFIPISSFKLALGCSQVTLEYLIL